VTGIHQILAAASPGDAITNSAIELRDMLRAVGPSEIYARHIAPELAGEIRRLEDYKPRRAGDVLVHHASIGEPTVHAFLLSRREPLVLVYHNVTPAHYFDRWDPRFAELLTLGRHELVDLRSRVSVAIAASAFNACELEALGYSNVRVIPPVIDAQRLTRVQPNPATLNHLDNVLRTPYFLYVGQLLPHKRPEFLVETIHVASTYLGVGELMMMVGYARLPSYKYAIEEQIRELNLHQVHLVGSVSTEDLAAFYTRASAVVTASDHEGFCVPLVEAMAFGRPVVARDCGAIRETLGTGGVCLPAESGPELFAETLYTLVEDEVLRDELGARALARAADFEPERARTDMVSALLEVV
jgi:glycosyltransferase involved in cell wall biosynthesis